MTLWNSLHEYLTTNLDKGFGKTILKRIHYKECRNDTLIVLNAEDAFSKGWFEEHCLPLLQEKLIEDGIQKEFRIEIAATSVSNSIEREDQQREIINLSTPKRDHYLAPEFTFERFIPGDCNDFQYQAAMSMAKERTSRYNPFVIAGRIGTGKTHLAQAIVHRFENNFPEAKTVYITGEDFMNEFIKHIQMKTMNIFREKYRNCDLLVMEDIQNLQEKESTAEELENIFNALYSRGSQMVFTADRPIEKLRGLKARLRGRLSGGLSVELKNPKFETRKAILLNLVEQEKQKVDSKVIDLIAEIIDDNLRDLKGTLIKMLAYADLKKRDISLKLAKEILSDKIQIDIPNDLSINEIQRAVASYFGIKLSDIKSDSKLNTFSRPRQIAMFIASKHTNFTSTEIGSMFGKAHSTVIRSTQKIEETLPKDINLKKHIEKIILELAEVRH